MTILTGLKTHLEASAALTLVGSRIRTLQARQGEALPYLVYFLVSERHEHHMTAATGIARALVQFDCIGESVEDSVLLSEELREALDGFRGSMGSVVVSRCHLSVRAGPEILGPTDGSQIGKYRVRMDYDIDYAESVPTF